MRPASGVNLGEISSGQVVYDPLGDVIYQTFQADKQNYGLIPFQFKQTCYSTFAGTVGCLTSHGKFTSTYENDIVKGFGGGADAVKDACPAE